MESLSDSKDTRRILDERIEDNRIPSEDTINSLLAFCSSEIFERVLDILVDADKFRDCTSQPFESDLSRNEIVLI